MEILKGIAVSPGVAINPAYLLGRQTCAIAPSMADGHDAEHEIRRVTEAIDTAAADIRRLQARLRGTAAERYASIVDAHLAMLTDRRLFEEVSSRISDNGYSAEHAVSRVLGEYARTLSSVEDSYISQRAQDIFDIEQLLINALTGRSPEPLRELTEPVALIAHDLTPSETISLDRDKVTGFATDSGGATSHTAILAKALGVPAVVGLTSATASASGGDLVIIDGNKGLLVVDPDQATLKRYQASMADIRVMDESLSALKNLPAETTDGRTILLHGNIELPEEIPTAIENGAVGIGLFRTEFLYLKAGREPTEDEQFYAYFHAAEALGDKPLVIRTFDLGGEKAAVDSAYQSERNPSLGARSIRFCFEHPDIFRTQLRAILRAGVHGNVKLLFPMVSSVEEVRRARNFLQECRDELVCEGVPLAETLPVGIMVEVPSVAVAPEFFAPEVDFFSIGTNDLIQYSLAVERVNEHVAPLFTSCHPAILRLLKNVLDTSKRMDISLNLCGEMGADPLFSMLLVGLGFTDLSINPHALPRIKAIIRSFSFHDAREIARKALELPTAGDVKALLTANIPASAASTLT